MFHAFFWTKRKGMQDLGTLPGDVSSLATGINSRGEIVGFSCLDAACVNPRAFLLENGAMLDLNSLIPGSNLFLLLALDINSRGQIVGLAFDSNTQEFHAYLATQGDEEDTGWQRENVTRSAITHQNRNVILPENIRQHFLKRLAFGSNPLQRWR